MNGVLFFTFCTKVVFSVRRRFPDHREFPFAEAPGDGHHIALARRSVSRSAVYGAELHAVRSRRRHRRVQRQATAAQRHSLSPRGVRNRARVRRTRAMTPRDASRRAQSCPRASLAWNVPTRFTRAFGASRHHAQKLSWKASLHVRYGGANARDVLSRAPSPRGVDRVSIELVSGNRRARSSRPRRTHLDSNAGSSASRHPRLTAAEREAQRLPDFASRARARQRGDCRGSVRRLRRGPRYALGVVALRSASEHRADHNTSLHARARECHTSLGGVVVGGDWLWKKSGGFLRWAFPRKACSRTRQKGFRVALFGTHTAWHAPNPPHVPSLSFAIALRVVGSPSRAS